MLTEEEILDFLSNFGLYKSGCYNVPGYVVTETLRYYIKYKETLPLDDYDREMNIQWCLHQSKDLPFYSGPGENDIKFLQELLDQKRYWKPQTDWIDRYQRQIDQYTRFIEYRGTYTYKRRKASSYTSNKKTREKVFSRDGEICVSCGATEDLTLDHIIQFRRAVKIIFKTFKLCVDLVTLKRGIRYEF